MKMKFIFIIIIIDELSSGDYPAQKTEIPRLAQDDKRRAQDDSLGLLRTYHVGGGKFKRDY
jgi:hypothetical protein